MEQFNEAQGGSYVSISAVSGILELEQILKQKTFSRSEADPRTGQDPKRLMASPRCPATLENLPSDILLKIFIRLLAKQLAKMRCYTRVDFHISNSLISSNSPPVIPDSEDTTGDMISVIGSVHGLICSRYSDSGIQIWNPSLSSVLTLPPHYIPCRGPYEIFFQFGFDPKTDDYKVVKVIGLTAPHIGQPDLLPYPVKEWLQVEVYSMRKGSWGFITQKFPSRVTEIFLPENVCVDGHDGHLHWLGYIGEEGDRLMIVAFDMGSETFSEMTLPVPDVVIDCNGCYPLGVLAGKLCFITWVANDDVCEVWVMEEYGVAESWVKHHVFSQFSYGAPSFGFTTHSEFVIEDDDRCLVLYDPIADKAKILEKYCPKFGTNKIVEYVDSLVWVAPSVR
ncbi:unnamed protein product [Lactuca virosa]|uniref:F-box associated beta-propeller type 3 domain-containing protein n=1 Tax=Lactuca virosa TaxID=75947 RepID=A0AAU9PIN3_9ASTR|nr:unnamed protein product [Lactuca virosa]